MILEGFLKYRSLFVVRLPHYRRSTIRLGSAVSTVSVSVLCCYEKYGDTSYEILGTSYYEQYEG